MVKTYADTLDEQIRAANWCAEELEDARRTFAPLLTRADSYFASSDFCSLVTAASQTIPAFKIDPSDLPTPTGWLSLAQPLLLDDLIQGEQITHVKRTDGRGVGLFATDFPGATVTALSWIAGAGEASGNCFLMLFNDYGPLPAAMISYGHFESTGGLLIPWMKAFWLLTSQQNVSETTEEAPPRQARKRAQRAGVNPLIRVIRLPRRVREQASAEHGAVDWQSRWIVRGHWRQQPWGPERKRVRPVWIAPYVKGPEGKPLKESAHRLFVADTPEP